MLVLTHPEPRSVRDEGVGFDVAAAAHPDDRYLASGHDDGSGHATYQSGRTGVPPRRGCRRCAGRVSR